MPLTFRAQIPGTIMLAIYLYIIQYFWLRKTGVIESQISTRTYIAVSLVGITVITIAWFIRR